MPLKPLTSALIGGITSSNIPIDIKQKSEDSLLLRILTLFFFTPDSIMRGNREVYRLLRQSR